MRDGAPQWSLVFPTRMTIGEQQLLPCDTLAAMEPGLSDQDDQTEEFGFDASVAVAAMEPGLSDQDDERGNTYKSAIVNAAMEPGLSDQDDHVGVGDDFGWHISRNGAWSFRPG